MYRRCWSREFSVLHGVNESFGCLPKMSLQIMVLFTSSWNGFVILCCAAAFLLRWIWTRIIKTKLNQRAAIQKVLAALWAWFSYKWSPAKTVLKKASAACFLYFWFGVDPNTELRLGQILDEKSKLTNKQTNKHQEPFKDLRKNSTTAQTCNDNS